MTKTQGPAEGTSPDINSSIYHRDAHKPCSNYATMRFEPESLHGANAGLDLARSLMEKVKAEFPWISYGDLWTLAGVAAIQVPICYLIKGRLTDSLFEGNVWSKDPVASW
jgi:hypothetical protein